MALPRRQSKEYLDSDRLNFLIWRYLLEGNYRETAAKFQKEWHVAAPHQQFAFASHVQNQALVQVVQRGLLYHAFQRQFAQQTQNSGGEGGDEALAVGIFGPVVDGQGAHDDDHEDAEGEPDEGEPDTDHDSSRKRTVDRRNSQLINGSPAVKRPRLSNGCDNGADIIASAPVPGTPTAEGTGIATAPAAASTAVTAATGPSGPSGPTSTTSAMDLDDDQTHHYYLNSDHAEPSSSHNYYHQPQHHYHHHHNNYPHHHHHLHQQPHIHQQQHQQHQQQQEQHHLHQQQQQQQISNNAYPSPLECEQQPPPLTLHTQGPDKGTQLDKVEELATATTFLQLTPDPASPLRAGTSSHAPVLLHCEWNPKDPSSLAAAGTDSLARIWTVARSTAASMGSSMGPDHSHVHGHGHVNGDGPSPSFCRLIPESTPANAVVTGLAWNRDGSAVAVAINNNDSSASISIWSAAGECMQQLNVNEPPVIQLRWNPNNVGLLAIAPDDGGTAVTIYSGDVQLVYVLPNYVFDRPLDAAWISETEFLLCGRNIFLALRCTPTQIEVVRQFETRQEDSFSRVLFDWRSRLVATTSDGDESRGNLDLWDQDGQRLSIAAHSGSITAIQWQPLQCNPADHERLVATAGDDNTIAIWNARAPDSPERCRLLMNSPVLAISFTPDGAFLAGATADDVLIWKVGDYFMPRAGWTRPPHPGWLSPRLKGDLEEEEDCHTLCWDASGQKLAYGVNSRLAVIRFR